MLCGGSMVRSSTLEGVVVTRGFIFSDNSYGSNMTFHSRWKPLWYGNTIDFGTDNPKLFIRLHWGFEICWYSYAKVVQNSNKPQKWRATGLLFSPPESCLATTGMRGVCGWLGAFLELVTYGGFTTVYATLIGGVFVSWSFVVFGRVSGGLGFWVFRLWLVSDQRLSLG